MENSKVCGGGGKRVENIDLIFIIDYVLVQYIKLPYGP
jgi:hypothetical protein